VRGILLCHLGRCGEAEQLLVQAYDAIEDAMPGMAWPPPIALAELRVLQGRLAEAEALLLGRDDQLQALVPMARLHLARGDHELAGATARRGLRMLGPERLRGAALLGVLVEAHLGLGDRLGAASAVNWAPRPWPSCTARPSPVTAAGPSTTWPPPTNSASWPPAPSRQAAPIERAAGARRPPGSIRSLSVPGEASQASVPVTAPAPPSLAAELAMQPGGQRTAKDGSSGWSGRSTQIGSRVSST
jgi:hypothetical protein